jgi:hypothetical protein
MNVISKMDLIQSKVILMLQTMALLFNLNIFSDNSISKKQLSSINIQHALASFDFVCWYKRNFNKKSGRTHAVTTHQK